MEKNLEWLSAKTALGKRLHVERPSFVKLMARLDERLADVRHGRHLDAGHRLSATLMFLCTSSALRENKIDAGIPTKLLTEVVAETCETIVDGLADYIQCPQTEEEWIEIATSFNRVTHFPTCLGAACTRHIIMDTSMDSSGEYLNHFRRPSVLLSAIVDSNYEFRVVETCPGGHRFANTPNVLLKHTLQSSNLPTITNDSKNLPYVFVGDEHFQLEERCLISYSDESHTEYAEASKIYNRHINKVNQTSSKTLANMAWKFGVLQTPIKLDAIKVQNVVKACCYLHNFFNRESDGYMDCIVKRNNSTSDTCGFNLSLPLKQNDNTDYRQAFLNYFYKINIGHNPRRSSRRLNNTI